MSYDNRLERLFGAFLVAVGFGGACVAVALLPWWAGVPLAWVGFLAAMVGTLEFAFS